MIIRLRSDSSEAPVWLSWTKALNSVSASLMPSSWPALAASDQGMPIIQARGANTTPRPRSMLSGAPSTLGRTPSSRSAMDTRATSTIRVAPTLSTILSPSSVPWIRASTEPS